MNDDLALCLNTHARAQTSPEEHKIFSTETNVEQSLPFEVNPRRF
jgi:hypothetical protein